MAYSGTECCQCISLLKIETVIYKHKVVVMSREGKTNLDDELGGLRFISVFFASLLRPLVRLMGLGPPECQETVALESRITE